MLKLTSHTTIYDLLKNQRHTDVKFVCYDGEISGHLMMLAANCKWFQENKISCIALMGFSKKNVFEFLELVYTGLTRSVNNISIKQLTELFQCSIQETEIEEVNNMSVSITQNGVALRSPASASPISEFGRETFGKLYLLVFFRSLFKFARQLCSNTALLPNPFSRILKNSTGSHKTNEFNQMQISNSSPSLIPSTVESISKLRNSTEKLRTHSQSSDSSDILIIEGPPPPIVELTDTGTQQPYERLSPIINLNDRKKCDNNSTDIFNSVESDVLTSDDTDIDVEKLEIPSKKRKIEHVDVQENVPRQAPIENIPQESPVDNVPQHSSPPSESDDASELEIPPKRNAYRFDSTDVESEEEEIQRKTVKRSKRSKKVGRSFSSLKPGEINRMNINFEVEPIENMKSVCLICSKCYPNIFNHITEHHAHPKSRSEKCHNCSKKFFYKEFLLAHLEHCNNNSQA